MDIKGLPMPKLSTKILILLIVSIAVIVWIVGGLLPALIVLGCINPTNIGVFGDFFGVVNSLFSSLALAGVLVAVILQHMEMKNTQKSFMETYHLQVMESVLSSLTDDDDQQLKLDMREQLLRSLKLMRKSGQINDFTKEAGILAAKERLFQSNIVNLRDLLKTTAYPFEIDKLAQKLYGEIVDIHYNFMASEITRSFMNNASNVSVLSRLLLEEKDKERRVGYLVEIEQFVEQMYLGIAGFTPDLANDDIS